MLSVGIPEFRLPKEVLQKDIREMENIGVDIRLNTPVNDIEKLFADG
jgi:NADPH-dependent glutamate synthase beta subunit-like oxidoreductase